MKRAPRSVIYTMLNGVKFYVLSHAEEVDGKTGRFWPELTVKKNRARHWKSNFIPAWMTHYSALLPSLVFETEAEMDLKVAAVPKHPFTQGKSE